MLHMSQWLYMYAASFCSQCFICFFRRMLLVRLSRCCICFTYMFVSVLSGCCVCFYNSFKYFSVVFASVLYVCLKCFICLQTYVASAAYECFKSRSGVASPSPSTASSRCLLLFPAPAGHPPPPLSLFDVDDVRGGKDPMWARKTAQEKDCRRGCSDAPSIRTSRR
jgi:hypothetical protein